MAECKKIRVFVLGLRGFPDVQGGVEKHCEEIYPRLVNLGCEVIVAARSPYVPKSQRLGEWEGVKFIYLWAPRNKFLEAITHTFLGLLRVPFFSPNIVHIHAIGPSILTPLARILGRRVVVTNHGPDYLRKKWGKFARYILTAGEFLGIKFAHKVIIISKTVRSMIFNKYGRRDAEYIPNGVSRPELVPPGETLDRFGLEAGKYVFTAARFVPEKGLHDSIAAYQMIRDPAFKLVIAGDADHEDRWSRELKRSARGNGRIVLTGFLFGEPLRELYTNAGLFVLPSYYEGLPIALLEAISYGLPVLVSDIPANLEVGLPPFRYFPVGDVCRLSSAMAALFRLGITGEEKEGQQRILEENYNWDRVARRTRQVYEDALR